MANKIWAKVQKVPKSFNLASPYMSLIRHGNGWKVYKYHRTKKTAQKEADRINKLNKGRK